MVWGIKVPQEEVNLFKNKCFQIGYADKSLKKIVKIIKAWASPPANSE